MISCLRGNPFSGFRRFYGPSTSPPLFSDEWLEFHAELLARFKRYSLSFGIAALLAVAALLMMEPAAKVNSPQKVAEISGATSSASFVPALPTGHDLPGRFYEQQKIATR